MLQVRIIPLVRGTLPRARYNHASVNFHDNYLVVFGGKTNEKCKNNDFYIFEPAIFTNAIKLFDDDEDSSNQ